MSEYAEDFPSGQMQSTNGFVPWRISYFAGIVVNEVNSEPLVHIVIIQFLKRKTSKMVDIGKMAVEGVCTKLMAYIIL